MHRHHNRRERDNAHKEQNNPSRHVHHSDVHKQQDRHVVTHDHRATTAAKHKQDHAHDTHDRRKKHHRHHLEQAAQDSQQAESDSYDQGLHDATGTVSQVQPGGSPSYNENDNYNTNVHQNIWNDATIAWAHGYPSNHASPLYDDLIRDKGYPIRAYWPAIHLKPPIEIAPGHFKLPNIVTHGHDGQHRERNKGGRTTYRNNGGGGFGGFPGYLFGSGGTSTDNTGGTSGSGASGGSGMIIIGVLVLGVGGFLLWHKVHHAAREESSDNKKDEKGE